MGTRITLVRHGETEWNLQKKIQGQNNSPLSPNGLMQAKMVGRALKDRHFDLFVSSDLGRARQTAEAINRFLHQEIVYDSRFRERSFGIFEGNTLDETQKQYPTEFNQYKKRSPHYTIPKGESLQTFYTRVIHGLEDIAASHSGKEILIVAHGLVLESAMYKIFGIDLTQPRQFTIRNSSINTFEITQDHWFLEEWGIVEHLQSATALNEL